MPNPVWFELTGTYNRWTVIRFSHSKNGKRYWWCRCQCGTEKAIVAGNLKNGTSKSCGCLDNEKRLERNFKHGHAQREKKSRTWMIWVGIKDRCSRNGHTSYKYYGGRGVIICDGWKNDFSAFLAAVGERPPGLTIDRRDPYGHYSCGYCMQCQENHWPMNCRWATKKEQAQNRRRRAA